MALSVPINIYTRRDRKSRAPEAGFGSWRRLDRPSSHRRKLADQDSGAPRTSVVACIDHQLNSPYRRSRRTYPKELEAGKVSQAKSFFNLVAAHTRQSFYGDSRHGGNTAELRNAAQLDLRFAPAWRRVAGP